ncbi:MAG: response regulator [Opitutales bacterium]
MSIFANVNERRPTQERTGPADALAARLELPTSAVGTYLLGDFEAALEAALCAEESLQAQQLTLADLKTALERVSGALIFVPDAQAFETLCTVSVDLKKAPNATAFLLFNPTKEALPALEGVEWKRVSGLPVEAVTLLAEECRRRLLAQAQTIATHEEFCALLDSIVHALMVVDDGDGRIRFANAAAVRLWGGSLGPLEGQLWGTGARGMGLQEVEVSGGISHVDTLQIRGRPVLWDGKPATLVVLDDVTAEKRMEARLRESQDRLKTAFEHGPVGMAVIRLDNGRLSEVNRQFAQQLGWSDVDLEGMTLKELGLAPASLWESLTAELSEHGSIAGREVELQRRDRSTAELVLYVEPIMIGHVRYATIFAVDLSEANRQRRLLQTLLYHLPVSVFVRSARDYRFQFWNKKSEEIYGRSFAEVVGKTPLDFISEDDFEVLKVQEREILKTGRNLSVPGEVIELGEGQRQYLNTTKVPIFGPNHEPECILGISEDITSHVEMQNRMASALEEAEKANAYKSEFLANMSHEIRSPLNGVIGASELLANTNLTGEQQEYVSVIGRCGEGLLSLISDILDLSKIEAGQVKLEEVDFRIYDCLEDVIGMFSSQAQAKSILLTEWTEPSLPEAVIGDYFRLRQILANLVGNALKFTSKGEIEISVRAEARSNERVRCRFTVRDTGIGIPPEKLSDIFQAFRQADSSTTRRYGGTGLGLTICRSLVHLMGGEIEVHSEPGTGSIFSFTVSLRRDKRMREPLPELEALSGKRALVVIDSEGLRLSFTSTLERWAIEVMQARSTQEALEVIQANDSIDFAIIDYQLSDRDGWELGQAIRELQRKLHLFLVVSGKPTSLPAENRQNLFHAFITQPVRRRVLISKLANAFLKQASRLGELPERKPTHHGLPAFTTPGDQDGVLVVEDSPDNQLIVVRLLRKFGFQRIWVAENGVRALEVLKEKKCSHVLMDLQMPQMDGFATTREIRRRFGDESRPRIVALTASASKNDRQSCLAAGMDDYLAKPVRSEQLATALGLERIEG